jgi:hypothetical protein
LVRNHTALTVNPAVDMLIYHSRWGQKTDKLNLASSPSGYDESNIGLKGGLGFAIGLSPKLDLDLRGGLLVVPQEDGGSKKGALITGGVTVNL